MARLGKVLVGVFALVVVLAACGFGETRPAVQVTDETAELTGLVHNTVAGTTSYWFEYGKTTAYGLSTSHRSLNVADNLQGYPVSETVSGLDHATTYHARLCAYDRDGHGWCGNDQPVTTADAEDWVNGSGLFFKDPVLERSIGVGAFATSNPDGANPAGDASNVNLSFRFGYSGPVTCLRVVGNRAAIGFLASPPDGTGLPPGPPQPRLIFIEDNGPTGDRFGVRDVSDATTCPTPTAADFPNITFGSLSVPPVISDGDFVVHDSPPS